MLVSIESFAPHPLDQLTPQLEHFPIDFTRHEGCRLPVAVRRVSNEAFAALAASAQARHRRVGSGLVDENEPVGIKRRLFALPLLASRRHVGAQLLRRAKAFFLTPISRASKNRQSDEMLVTMPRSRA